MVKPQRSDLTRRPSAMTALGSVSVLVGWLLLPAGLNAQGGIEVAQNAQRLRQLTLEELSEIRVTSVSRREELAATAAAAVSVVSSEDLRRSGVTSIPEALRLVPGVEVARSSPSGWAVGIRGFNISSTNKLQVMMDGRILYSPLFAGTFWDAQGALLEDIERIEVIRGPGATLWGTNAVNGVINIITKSASATQGGLVLGGGGNETRFGAVRWGGRAGANGFYRFSSKYDYFDAFALSDGSSARDQFQRGSLSFRSDWTLPNSDQLTVQGDLYRLNSDRPTADDINSRGGNMNGRWARRFGERSELQVQSYFDRTSREISPLFFEVRNSFDIDMQHHLAVTANNNVVWGLGYRASADETRNTVPFEPQERTLHWFSFFAQDEFALIPDRLQLVFGSKLEHNSYSGLEVQPTIRLAWMQGTRHLLWGGVSRALRTPTRLDADLRLLTPSGGLSGNPAQKPEELLAFEGGYRLAPLENLVFSINGYYNKYDDLRSLELPVAPGRPLVQGNTLEGRTYGGEAVLTVQLQPWWQVQTTYSHLQLRLQRQAGSRASTPGTSEANDPRNQVGFRSYMDLGSNVELDFWMRHVSGLPVAAARQPRVPGYVTFDVRLGWNPADGLELSVVGQNLPEDQHAEFPTDGPQREVQRSVYGKVAWSF